MSTDTISPLLETEPGTQRAATQQAQWFTRRWDVTKLLQLASDAGTASLVLDAGFGAGGPEWWTRAPSADAIAAVARYYLAISQQTRGDAVKHVAARLLGEVPAVDHVACLRNGTTVHLWSVTQHRDRESNRQTHARELALYDYFPEGDFEFYILALAGRPLKAALPEGFEVIWSRS